MVKSKNVRYRQFKCLKLPICTIWFKKKLNSSWFVLLFHQWINKEIQEIFWDFPSVFVSFDVIIKLRVMKRVETTKVGSREKGSREIHKWEEDKIVYFGFNKKWRRERYREQAACWVLCLNVIAIRVNLLSLNTIKYH